MNRTKNKMYHFMIFFISQTVSELGTSMTGFATVIWMYSNSGQVMSSSLLAICSTVPYLIVSLCFIIYGNRLYCGKRSVVNHKAAREKITIDVFWQLSVPAWNHTVWNG